MEMHKTAIVDKDAKLADSVRIGPYAIIGADVAIGENCEIGAHCVIEGNTEIGANCRIFIGAVIGSPPQDLKYKGQRSYVKIGDSNIIREYVTINPGTGEGELTIIGNSNLLMAYSHVAHNCVIGNNCIMANVMTLAGYVTIEDNAVLGGLAGVHQFVRIGKLAIVGGCSKLVQDAVPFSITSGHPAKFCVINRVGLKRAGIGAEAVRKIEHALKILCRSQLSVSNALKKIEEEAQGCREVGYIAEFVKNTQRGIAR